MAFSQNECAGITFLENANELANGCPLLFDQTTFPLLEIRVNFHFIRGANSNESFTPDVTIPNNPWNGNAMANRVVNYWLSNQYWPNLLTHPNANQPSLLGDSRIRMLLYTEPNTPDDLWGGVFYWDNIADVALSPYSNTLNIIVHSDDPGDTNINTIDLPDDPSTPDCDPTFRGFSAVACGLASLCDELELWSVGNKIRYDCEYTGNNDLFYASMARNIMHEFGHITGLCHSFAPDNSCTDVNAMIECNGTAADGGSSSCGGDHVAACDAGGSHTNNIMSYGSQLRSLTPCQWTTMYGYLYEEEDNYVNITTNGSCDLVLPGQSTGTVIIPTGTNATYDEVVFMFDDIVIEPTASLRIPCLLLMAEKKTITVKRGGKLIVDGGTIANMKVDEPWDGIFVEGNSSEIQTDPSLLDPIAAEANLSGAVILNNANIIGANTAISTHRKDASWDSDYWGGLIAANRTNFTNNRRAVEFMAYQMFTGSFPDNSLVPNKSLFDHCVFEEIGAYRENTTGVTIWACNDITFKACRFENLDRSGIYGINCGFNVINDNITNSRETVFRNIRRPIEFFSTYTNSSYHVNIEQAEFIFDSSDPDAPTGDITHIAVHASSELSDFRVSDCLFQNGLYGIWIVDPARNCFEDDSDLFVASTTESFIYHVNTVLLPPYAECVYVPTPNSNFTVDDSGLNPSLIVPIDCTYELRQFGKPDQDDQQDFDDTRQDIVYYQNYQQNAQLSVSQRAAYTAAKDDYNSLYRTMLGYYQYSDDLASMESFLLNDALPSEYTERSLLGAYLEHEDWTKATTTLNNLANTTYDEQAYKSVMQINLAAAQQEYAGYTPSAGEVAQLHQIADGLTASRAYARALLAFYEEASYDPDDDNPVPLPAALQTGGEINPVFLRTYPNPASDALIVRLSEEEIEMAATQTPIQCRIVSLDGRVEFNQSILKNARNVIEISEVPAGMYLLEIKLPTGKTEFEKIIIQ
jgi:hypothetical protein